MNQELFNPQSSYVSSSRIIYTPSTFARTSLLHLQEVGSLQAVHVYSEVTGKPLQDRLYRYMDDANLSISEMEPYFAYYPDKLYKNLVETRVIYKDMEEEILLEKKKRDGL